MPFFRPGMQVNREARLLPMCFLEIIIHPENCPLLSIRIYNQLPDFEDYSMKGRTYRFMSDPLFPFGFGLSYTSFLIGNASFSKTSVKANESIELSIPVSNTGKRAGTEIVQVYIRKVNDNDGPIKTLRNFQRMDIAAGKSDKAVINLPYTSFEFFDRATGKMSVIAGEYEVLYGNSSDDKHLKKNIITIL